MAARIQAAIGWVLVLGVGACDQSGRELGPHADAEISAADVVEPDGADDTAVDTTVADTAPSPGCKVAESLFTPYCVRCHNQTDDYPNLNPGALEHIVGSEAAAYPGQMLVVAGDPNASLLYRKVHAPGADDGLQMPPDGDAPPAEAIADLTAWILAGAPACDGHTDPGPMTVPVPVPGAGITFGNAPNGFQTTKPSWSDDGACSAQQWWRYSGTHESELMHPGQACIDCHSRGGDDDDDDDDKANKDDDAPAFSYAGTVFPAIDDANDCRGVSGVKVEILDGDDAVIGSATSNNAGNFYIRSSSLRFRAFRARLSFQGREREMQLIQSSSGDCNTCHDSSGKNGTLGRIVAP